MTETGVLRQLLSSKNQARVLPTTPIPRDPLSSLWLSAAAARTARRLDIISTSRCVAGRTPKREGGGDWTVNFEESLLLAVFAVVFPRSASRDVSLRLSNKAPFLKTISRRGRQRKGDRPAKRFRRGLRQRPRLGVGVRLLLDDDVLRVVLSSACTDYIPALCTHRPSLLPIE